MNIIKTLLLVILIACVISIACYQHKKSLDTMSHMQAQAEIAMPACGGGQCKFKTGD